MRRRVADLSPLKGMPLTHLDCCHITPSSTCIAAGGGMPLTYLRCGAEETKISDWSPLKKLNLAKLSLYSTPKFSDLSVLSGLPLKELDIGGTPVADLSPLKGMKLTRLAIINTRVTDLAPLQGMPLTGLACGLASVSDLAPLKGMPLTWLDCNSTQVSDLLPLADCKSLTDLRLKGSKVTSACAVAALQKALPNCKIEWDGEGKK